MALMTLSILGSVLTAYPLFRLFWSFFGKSILVTLWPTHYQIWSGTQHPRSETIFQLWRLIWVTLTSDDPDEHLLDSVFARQCEVVGPTFMRAGNELTTTEPANLQAMLATQFKDFATGPLRRNWLFPLVGNSIFTSDGSFWEHSRALFRPQFARENINSLDATETGVVALIAACGSTYNHGWTTHIDLSPLLYNFTLDTATEFLFGESIRSQDIAIRQVNGEATLGDDSIASADRFRMALELINVRIMWRMRLGHFYWLIDGLDFRRALRYVRTWTERYVQLALNAPPVSHAKGEKSNVLSTLASHCKDPSELRNQTLAIMFAGRDTTASLLGWIFRELAIHPEIYAKLRATILIDFPTDSQITFARLKSCRYLQHVINESLRLHPTVPLNTRIAVRDTTLPTGGGPDGKSPIAVEKGQAIYFSVYVMHRRKDLWGEDAHIFLPERWEKHVPTWHFLPFLGGPRICLGQQFALTEAGYLLVRMLQSFDRMEPTDPVEMASMKKTLGITMASKHGVHVRLHRANV